MVSIFDRSRLTHLAAGQNVVVSLAGRHRQGQHSRQAVGDDDHDRAEIDAARLHIGAQAFGVALPREHTALVVYLELGIQHRRY
jgi:phage replication-related protein YjqB (UPF0714/DUF867 family)